MSIKFMNIAFESDLSPSEKLVLLALCDYADNQGRCWPSLSHIATKCSMTETGISRIISRLEGKWLTKKRRFGKSIIYTISTEEQNSAKVDAVSTEEQDQFQPSVERIYEPSKEPPNNHHEEGFANFWEVYPKKVAKKAAFKAYERALKETDHETIMIGIKQYAIAREGQDEKYTANPATWLNQGRWEDQKAEVEDFSHETPEERTDRRQRAYYAETGKWLPSFGNMPEDLKNGQ